MFWNRKKTSTNKFLKYESSFEEKLYFAPSFFDLKFGQDAKLGSNQSSFLA